MQPRLSTILVNTAQKYRVSWCEVYLCPLAYLSLSADDLFNAKGAKFNAKGAKGLLANLLLFYHNYFPLSVPLPNRVSCKALPTP